MADKRTYDVLPKPDNLIRYRQISLEVRNRLAVDASRPF